MHKRKINVRTVAVCSSKCDGYVSQLGQQIWERTTETKTEERLSCLFLERSR